MDTGPVQRYVSSMRIALILTAAIAAFAGVASAQEALPGVVPPEPLVRPLPEPDALPAAPDGSFLVGNTRVKISGSVTVDIGFGETAKPR